MKIVMKSGKKFTVSDELVKSIWDMIASEKHSFVSIIDSDTGKVLLIVNIDDISFI